MRVWDILKLWLQKNLLLFEDLQKFRTVSAIRVISFVVVSITFVVIYQLFKRILTFDMGFVVGIFAIFISWLFFWSSQRIQTQQSENLINFIKDFKEEAKKSFEKINAKLAEGPVSQTDEPLSPQLQEETEEPPDLLKESKRILATLWQRQKHHFKEDFTGRWSFRVLPNAEGYGNFMLGFAELLKLGFVSWTRKDGQAFLTDKGIEYLKEHPEIQDSDDVYRF